ncbi:hypothetical protein [Streptomyces hygroscopicus]|uniref:hypothetical protein n=1 Tax=Streptomyces hygroscopicus TaxID=1912 RepID=UPI00099E374C|nr:hypothetical protein [Streptomyces hygroscopicus]GLV80144.1 hypothetical protein Shyhy02_81440 [Streptomyces hygroscopicus subsp. hygroscopicus]
MGLVAEYSVDATPGSRFTEIYDADAYLDDAAAMDAARHQVVAGNGYHLYLHSLQADIPVRITIRIWDAPPPCPPSDAEGSTTVTIESATGNLVINQLTYGPAGAMDLPRAGFYEGFSWWTGRQAMRDYYDTVLSQLADSGRSARLPNNWRHTQNTERYFLDLMWVREPQSLDDDL